MSKLHAPVFLAAAWRSDTMPGRINRSLVAIRTMSISKGDVQRDETLKSSDWLSVGAFETTIFKASKFRKTGMEGGYASISAIPAAVCVDALVHTTRKH